MRNQSLIKLEPRADRLVGGLRQVGYENYWAICDLLDNSIDAGADVIDILVRTVNGSPMVRISDNGTGMNKESLIEAMRLGADTGKIADITLGLYGMGLKTASWSIAKTLTVLSKTPRMKTPIKAVLDIDTIQRKHGFVVSVGSPSIEDKKRFGKGCGTEITLTNCDHFANRNTTEFAANLLKRLQRVFRYKIHEGISITVNDVEAEPYDPMHVGDEEKVTHVLYDHFEDGMIPVVFTDSTGKTVNTEVGFRAVMLNNDAFTATSGYPRLSIKSQGISYIRNGREIVQDEVWGASPYTSRHNKWNQFRAEIHLSGDLDPYFGVPFTKRNVEMEAHLKMAIQGKIKRFLLTAEKINKATYHGNVLTSDKLRLIQEDVEAVLSKMAQSSLIDGLPKIQKAVRKGGQRKQKGTVKTPATRRKGGIHQKTARVRKAMADYVKFENVSWGASGMLWEVGAKGTYTIIQLNTDHPFYKEVLARKSGKSTSMQAVYSLLYFLGIAEMQMCEDDDSRVFLFDDLKQKISANTRKFVQVLESES